MQYPTQLKPNIHWKNDYCKIFGLCLLMAALIFLPFLIYDHGIFLYYGDYNVQQIPFYRLAQQAVKEGNIFWDWNTDLGANFIGSYAFYLLGSPFFWLTTLFPNAAVPYLMAPLLMLKFACAGVSSFAFLKRFTKTNNMAMLGALLYAFSGFNIYNIFFNHFHEAVIIFPLMLVALEEAVYNNRRGWFAVTVFLAATMNYFFFAGQVVFILLYFILRCLDRRFPIALKALGVLAFEAVLGVLMACALLLPAALAIMDNPRLNMLSGMSMLFYSDEQRYGLILSSLFFPPDIPARPNFFPDSNAKWSSVSAFLPLFSMTGVVVFAKNYKKHWLKRMLGLCLVMALIPILNTAFYAFNSSYYARWFYMPTLMMALATCIALENEKIDYKYGVRFTLGAVLAFSVIGIIPKNTTEGQKWFAIPPYPERFWGYVAIALASLLMVALLLWIPRHTKKFMRYATLCTCGVILVYSIMMLGTGKAQSSPDSYQILVEEGLNGADNFSLDESVFYRVDEDKAQDNMPMYWYMPTIQCFHSVVPVSIMNFYESIGVQRNVASRPELEFYGVRAITSVKYLFCRTTENDQPDLPGFIRIGTQNNYNVYENQYFIPMGFTYDYYVNEDSYYAYTEKQRDKLLVKAMCLSNEDAETYGYLMQELPKEQYPDLSNEDYFASCKALQNNAGYSFTYSSTGFTSKIKMDRENLVFYSVPYEKGWTATVNGEPAEIVTANVGFMAVKAPAGDNTIEFHYETPGLKAGIVITGASFLLLAIYLLIIRYLRKKYPEKYFVGHNLHRNELFASEKRMLKTADAYAEQILESNRTDTDSKE